MFLSSFRADSGDDRSPYGNFWFSPVSRGGIAGAAVTTDSAMRLSAVYACVRVLAETFAVLPLVLYRKKAGGGKEIVTDHWLFNLLSKRPNRFQNAFEWREMMQAHLALAGNAFNRITTNSRGEITELMPIAPRCVTVEMLDSGEYRYRVNQRDGSTITLTRADVWHLRGLSSDGIVGLNPIEIARDVMSAGLAAQNYASRFFANDARPSGGWIEFPGSFKDAAAKDTFRSSWKKAQGGKNQGNVAVLEHGMKYHDVGPTNKDSQFLESRKLTVTEIARIFRVPPHMIGDLDRATFSNIEQQSLDFVNNTMTPWAERWEASIEADLLLEEGPDADLEVEFDFAALLRGDQAARTAYYASGITTGWLTRNEAREKENLDPLDGLSEPLQPLNQAVVGEEPPEPAGAPPAPTPPAGMPQEPDADDSKDARLVALLTGNAQRMARRMASPPTAAVLAEALAIGEDTAASWLAGPIEGPEEAITQSLVALALKGTT